MHKFTAATALILICGTASAGAADLQSCKQGSTKHRLACLEQNIIVLNSSYEKVATELRQAVVDINKKIGKTGEAGTLRGDLDKLTESMNNLPPLDQLVQKNSTVKLSFSEGQCIVPPTGMDGALTTSTNKTVAAQTLTLLQACGAIGANITFR